MAPAVRLLGAVSLIGRYPALAGVDLEVEAGEVVVMHGPNGAGKTSILRLCAGLLAAVDGQVEVLGEDLRQDRRNIRRRVGLLGHDCALYDDLTAAENVRFAVRATGGNTSSVEPALRRLQVDGRLARVPAGRLSAGQRRRVALAALVARSPEMWLLDEPNAGLDPAGRAVLEGVVRDAARSGGTVLIASHETAISSQLADRVVTVAGGQVLGSTTPERTADGVTAAGVTTEPTSSGRDSAPRHGVPAHVA